LRRAGYDAGMRLTPRTSFLIAALAAISVLAGCSTSPLEAAQRDNRVAGHDDVDGHSARREMRVAHHENADHDFAACMQSVQQTLKP
jgi:hypothetical protein